MNRIFAMLLNVVIITGASSCGRNPQHIESGNAGSRLASVTIKKPVDADGLLKAGVDYDRAEILFLGSETNAKWQIKTTLTISGEDDNTDKALNFAPGSYTFNMKLINSKTKTIVAMASADDAACKTPSAALVAGKNTPVGMTLCRVSLELPPSTGTDPGTGTGGDADVTFAPQIVSSSDAKSVLELVLIEGMAYPDSASLNFSLKNTSKAAQSCDAKITWIATLDRRDNSGNYIVKKWDDTKAIKLAAEETGEDSFNYNRPSSIEDTAKAVSIEFSTKCEGEKNFKLHRKGDLKML